MDLRTVSHSKHTAVLEVLNRVIVLCPAALQNVPGNPHTVYKRLGTHKIMEHHRASS